MTLLSGIILPSLYYLFFYFTYHPREFSVVGFVIAVPRDFEPNALRVALPARPRVVGGDGRGVVLRRDLVCRDTALV